MKRFTLKHKAYAFVASAMMLMGSQSAMAQYVELTALSGSKFNDGEGVEKLVDGKLDTKWGQSHDANNPDRADAHIIFKAATAVVPTNYFVCTGGDTGAFPDRNWEDWQIYAANFDSDSEATTDAEGWVLVDEKRSELLPNANNAFADYQFSNTDGKTAYKYYYIRVTQSAKHGDTWLQMSEFGLCTTAEFKAWQAGEDKPVAYTIIAGDRWDTSGESLTRLFDGNYGTKWGNGITENKKGDTSNGQYFIIKTSRPMSPNYIKLVTGTDNATWTHRNWRDWDIYAIEGVNESNINRNSAGWVEIASWDHMTEEVLPDKNSFELFLNFDRKNDKKYQYFKVEIHAIMSGNGWMQMSEFALGDEAMAVIDKQTIYDRTKALVDLDAKFQKSLYDAFATELKAITETNDIVEARAASLRAEEKVADINASISAYKDYLSVVASLRNHYENHDCISGDIRNLIEKYLNENVAPNDDFKNGSYPYVIENCLLDVDAITAEKKFANAVLEYNATDLTDGALEPEYLTWTALSSSRMDGNEGFPSLFDHKYSSENGTKWGFSGAGWGIVKCEDGPIDPTWYTLCVANDTDGAKGRQWKSWRIYGGNFASDEEATRDAQGWVLIDQKDDIADNDFPTTNFSKTSFSMTNGGGSYQYFRIEVTKNRDGNTTIGSGNYTQMGEIIFYNDANFRIDRNEKYEEMALYLEEAEQNPFYKKYAEEYEQKLADLVVSSTGVEEASIVSDLEKLQGTIEESIELYLKYSDKYGEMDASLFSDYAEGTTSAWAEQYFANEAVAPGTLLPNGSYEYIINNGNLSNEDIVTETEYLSNMKRVAENDGVGLVYLSGYVVNQWGDGHPKNLVDGITGLDPETGKPIGNNPPSKLGGNIDASGRTHVIFKTLDPSNPYFYTLMTGGDTFSYQDRNWGAWDIYGANFEGDAEATENAEGWVLVDTKNGVGKERLLPDNLTKSPFGFSSETTVPYQYYKIVVNSVFQNGKTEFVGGATQMQELTFGTEEEFDEIKQGYVDAAYEFDLTVTADQALITEYENTVGEIDDCINMEALFRINYNLEQLRGKITESAEKYKIYINNVEDTKAYLAENTLAASDELSTLKSYLDENVEPSEAGFPNGSAVYIVKEHVLNDSTVIAEIDYLKSLQAAAVAKGYNKGMDLTSMIVNNSFAKAEAVEVDGKKYKVAEGWEGAVFGNGTNAAMTMSAAEFCNDQAKFDVHQTLTGLKNGYYQVKLNAGFRPQGDIYSMEYAAMAYANDVKTYIPAVIEDMVEDKADSWQGNIEDKAIRAIPDAETEEEKGDTLGYVIWGVQGSCNAFLNGRYEISMVAKVTDGTLTFGIKNEGTVAGGNEWTSAGNFRLAYMGENEADAVGAIKEAVAYNADRATTMSEQVIAEAGMEGYEKAPGYAAADMEALEAIGTQSSYADLVADGKVFQNILDTKVGYNILNSTAIKVNDKYLDHSVGRFESALDDISAINSNLTYGEYANAEAAITAANDLMAKYPDYLAVSKEQSSAVVTNETDDFEYEITANGYRPYVTFKGFYEKLSKDRVILAYEYKSDVAVTGGSIMFGTPALNTATEVAAPEMPASSDWKRVYLDLTDAINNYGFGGADHFIHWDIVGKAESDITVNVRNVIVITVDECDDHELVDGVSTVETADVNSDVIYNLAGQRVGKAAKGLLIIGGKKYIVK